MGKRGRNRRKYLVWWQSPDPSTEKTSQKYTGADYYCSEGAGGAGFVEAIINTFFSLIGLAFNGVFAVLKLLLVPLRIKRSSVNDS